MNNIDAQEINLVLNYFFDILILNKRIRAS